MSFRRWWRRLWNSKTCPNDCDGIVEPYAPPLSLRAKVPESDLPIWYRCPSCKQIVIAYCAHGDSIKWAKFLGEVPPS